MSDHGERYAGGAVGFATAVVWITTDFTSALLCLAIAALGFGVVVGMQRTTPADVTAVIGTVRTRIRKMSAPAPRPTRAPRRRMVDQRQPDRQTAESASYGW